MPAETLLAIDFGTTNFKFGLVDPHGRLLALHRQPSHVTSVAAKREIDLTAFIECIRTGVAALRAARPGGLNDVAGIAVVPHNVVEYGFGSTPGMRPVSGPSWA